jgi:hypothetical protein
MRRVLIILILVVLPGASCLGQYTYFNERLQPGNYYYAGLVNNNLFEFEDELRFLTILIDGNTMTYSRADCNQNGQVVDVKTIHYSDTAEFSWDQGQSMILTPGNGYFQVGRLDMFTANQYSAHMMKVNEVHQLEWDFTVPGNDNEYVLYSYFSAPLRTESQSYVAAGNVIYHYPPFMSNDFETGFILTKVSSTGELIWHREYEMDELFPFQAFAVISWQIFELSNGDILVFGAYYSNQRPVVLKFDSLGNYLSYTTWGNPYEPPAANALQDGLANAIQSEGDSFIIAYAHSVYEPSPVGPDEQGTPRLGTFDGTTMTVALDEPLDFYHQFLGMVDFESTPDGGYAIFGGRMMYFYNTEIWEWDSYWEAYILKLDANRQQEWVKSYQPIVPEDDPNWNYYGWFYSADLIVTTDGGFAFLGEVMPYDQSELYAWLVKLDACGDVVFNGCPPSIGVAEPDKPADLMLHPNPATNQLNIILPPGGNRAEVYSLSGQLVMSQFVYPGWDRTVMDVEGLSGGMYMVRVVKESGDVLGAGRFLKE